jgi:WXG100 family type VII secretion target
MATIHVDTDLLRQLGQKFVQLNDQIQSQTEPQIQSVTGQLESSWQGQSRTRYEQMYQDWRAATSRIVTTGEDLGRHLQNTALQFEQADSSL